MQNQSVKSRDTRDVRQELGQTNYFVFRGNNIQDGRKEGIEYTNRFFGNKCST